MRTRTFYFMQILLLYTASLELTVAHANNSLIPKRISCAKTVPAEPFISADLVYQPKYHTLAHQFLAAEHTLHPVSLDIYAILDQLLDEAVAKLPEYSGQLTLAQKKNFAITVLNQIDCLLLSHGFVYPGHGTVQLLSDVLQPRYFNHAAQLHELKGQKYNIRRRNLISARGYGPFYIADCDTGAYIYLAIAEVMGYPLQLVDIPNHIFVRWTFSTQDFINYETLEGLLTNNDYYRQNWEIPTEFMQQPGIFQAMNVTQASAYHQATIAEAWSWQHNFSQMVALYQDAINLDANRPFAPANLAWYYAVTPDIAQRNSVLAVKYAQLAVEAFPSGDNLDTLACAYAQAGDFKRAIKIAQQALTTYTPLGADITGHIQRFTKKQRCIDPLFGKEPKPFLPL